MQILKQATTQNIRIGPFVDDGDGITPEPGLTIANTDIQISKDGVASVNKNSGGATADGTDGWYTIALDANDTSDVGLLQVTIDVAGALSVWVDLQVVEPVIYDGFFADAATALPASLVEINSNTVPVVNFENMYNGTGYIADTAPASRAQVGNLSSGSAAISTTATAGVVNVGMETNSYTDTFTQNDIEHEIVQDGSGNMNVEYTFSVGGSGVAVSVSMYGRFDGNGDELPVEAYNYETTSWDQVGLMIANSSSNADITFNLNIAHTGTSANLGEVKLRGIVIDASLSNVTLYVDTLRVSYSIVTQSVGYSGGGIWVDTVNGVSGIEPYVNGTADNPCPWADALTLSNSSKLNIKKFYLMPDSSVVLDANSDNYHIIGNSATLDLGSQSISGAIFESLTIIGIAGAAAVEPVFSRCFFNAAALPPCTCYLCGFLGSSSGTVVGDYFAIDCYSKVAGSGSPEFTLPIGGGTTISVRRFGGGLKLSGITTSDVISAEATVGGTLTIDGSDGDVEMRGGWKQLNDLSGGAVTIVRSKTHADMASIAGDENSAEYLAASALGIIKDLVETTGTTTTCTLTNITTEVDVLVGRVIVVTSGTYAGEAKTILANSADRVVTFDEMKGTLAQNDTVVLV